MRIGIVTTHQYQNFGTFLQCYALQHTLEKMGHVVEIIDYRRNDYKRSFFHQFRILVGEYRRSPKTLIKFIFTLRQQNRRNQLYKDFCNRFFNLSPKHYDNANELRMQPPIYDIYLSGSDQIWNPSICGFIPTYFLDFAPRASLKAAYAPSIGVSELSENERHVISDYLRDFSFLSCREQSGCQILNDCGFKNVECVLDPTFLLSSTCWERLSENSYIKETDYSLCYFLSENEEKNEKSRMFTGEDRVIRLTDNFRNGEHSILAAGPLEFLQLIRNAKNIVTDSFHGMVFCILFRKNFYMLPRHEENSMNSQNSRVIDLLKLLELYDRWNPFSINSCKPINYAHVERIVNLQKDKSIQYIRKILS